MPDEAAFARTARAYGLPPWALEAALRDDPAAFRWVLMADALAEFDAALAAAGDRHG